MHGKFYRAMLSYAVSILVIFIVFCSFISSAQSSSLVQKDDGGWLADVIISGVNLFIKLILAVA